MNHSWAPPSSRLCDPVWSSYVGTFPRLKPRATFTETPQGKYSRCGCPPGRTIQELHGDSGMMSAAMHACCRENDSDPATCSLPVPPRDCSRGTEAPNDKSGSPLDWMLGCLGSDPMPYACFRFCICKMGIIKLVPISGWLCPQPQSRLLHF